MDTSDFSRLVPIIVPYLGDTSSDYLLTAWFVEKSELVCKGDFLFEITVENVAVTVQAEEAGYLVSMLSNINEQTQSGKVIGYIRPSG